MRSVVSLQRLARMAVIAALYILLTFVFWSIGHGMIQVRVSEALTLLPLLTVDAIPALAIGCLLANALSGAVWFDVIFGTLATLLAACLTRKWRAHPLIAALAPVLLNAVITGTVVYFAYMGAPPPMATVLPLSMLSVGAGEAISVYLLGFSLLAAIKRIPPSIWR